MMHRWRARFRIFAIFPLLYFARELRAQEEYSRFEVGGEFAAFRGASNANGDVSFYSGLGGRFAWNLNRRLAFEAEVDGTPQRMFTNFTLQGGRALSAVVGVRAKILQSEHFSLFGLLRPGVLHFGAVGHGDAPFADRRAENFFTLNLGGGIEYYPSPRWILRFDITGDPYRVPNSTENITPLFGTAPVPTPALGEINDQFRLTFGVGYRLGKLREAEREEPVDGNLELGPQFTLTQMQRRLSATGVQSEPGVGGSASYPLPVFRFLYADGSLIYYPRRSQPGFQDGGTLLEGLFGLKGGVRRNRLGLFGKARPGFARSSQAVTGFASVAGGNPSTREVLDTYHTFAVDLGGVIEVYATKRQLLRIDIGDTHLYYHTTFIHNADGSVTTLPGGRRQHSIQTSVAYGWRF
jgi:hypothetical protein